MDNTESHNPIDLKRWEDKFRRILLEECLDDADSAHDLAHTTRVVASARRLAEREGAELEVVLPSAWLHDCVTLPKDHPDRKKASTLSADRAIRYLEELGYPSTHLDAIHHAIAAHSFSSGIEPETTEAAVVRDADRLDALGAIGLARCLTVGAELGRSLYNPDDPFCTCRQPDDNRWTLDHFYQKLLRLPEGMLTSAGRTEAERRVKFLKQFLSELRREIDEGS